MLPIKKVIFYNVIATSNVTWNQSENCVLRVEMFVDYYAPVSQSGNRVYKLEADTAM
jgi:hypothetical protein